MYFLSGITAFSTLDQNNDGLVTKSDFKSKFSNLSDAKIDLIFDRYNKKQNESLNFVEFKNFMNRQVFIHVCCVQYVLMS